MAVTVPAAVIPGSRDGRGTARSEAHEYPVERPPYGAIPQLPLAGRPGVRRASLPNHAQSGRHRARFVPMAVAPRSWPPLMPFADPQTVAARRALMR